MTRQEEASMTLSVWQQVRHLPPEQRLEALDDQVRMDALLREFYGSERERQAEFKRQMSCVLVEFPCVITGPQSQSLSSALS
jgi:hypothetical protein